jgi:5-methylthioadenosine/S-adenosylhomocysteine deaminase
MLERGVRVALGTDSRASNPDLSMLGEMRAVAERHTDVSASTLLELATQAGARALGLDGQMGTLEPGKLANIAIVQLAGGAADPSASLLHPDTRVVRTYVRGQEILTAGSS